MTQETPISSGSDFRLGWTEDHPQCSAFMPGNTVTPSRILSSTVDVGIVLLNMKGDKAGQNLVVPSGFGGSTGSLTLQNAKQSYRGVTISGLSRRV
ncbi:hypothetical protein AOLI_G00229900 [Acnodon oligacanthus]